VTIRLFLPDVNNQQPVVQIPSVYSEKTKDGRSSQKKGDSTDHLLLQSPVELEDMASSSPTASEIIPTAIIIFLSQTKQQQEINDYHHERCNPSSSFFASSFFL